MFNVYLFPMLSLMVDLIIHFSLVLLLRSGINSGKVNRWEVIEEFLLKSEGPVFFGY